MAGTAELVRPCGLIALSGLFIGHVTANIAVLGMTIATDVPGWGPKLLALPVFMAVVALTRVRECVLRTTRISGPVAP
jgi:uncharacterized membrane protein YoaK (UPF0700 family)